MAELNIHGSWGEVISIINKHELTPKILITILVIILAITLWYKFTLSSTQSPSLPPGPRSLPIIGYLPFLKPDLPKQFTNMAHTYGPIFKIRLGSKLHVVINTPELAKEVVRDQDEVFANHALTTAASIITYGGQDVVFSKNNSNWRNLRKIFVQEILSYKNLEASQSLRRDEVRKTVKNVFSKMGTEINISEISFLTEASVLTSLIRENTSNEGVKESNLGAQLLTVSSNITEIFGRANLSDFFPWLARFDLQRVERDMKKQLNELEQIFASIIEDRVKYNDKKSQDGVGYEEKKDFLQVLLDLKDKKDATSVTITQIKAILVDVMIAGTETTATLSEWVMAEIMQNDNIMKRVQEELAEVVGLENIVEECHLPKLQYLDATIKESLRLHPVAPFLVPRSPSKDCKVGGYTIPNNCTVFLNVWSIHRDPRYWDNPLEFNPERFLSYEEANKWDYNGNNLKFFPFGSGRRLCPGIQLAEKMQMFILASLLHSFNWRLPEGEEHDLTERFGVTLRKHKPLVAVPSQRLPDVSLYT